MHSPCIKRSPSVCSSAFPSVLATKPCAALRRENLLHGTQYFQDSWKMTVSGTVTSMEEYEGYVRQQTKTKNVMPVLKAGFTKLARRDPELSPHQSSKVSTKLNKTRYKGSTFDLKWDRPSSLHNTLGEAWDASSRFRHIHTKRLSLISCAASLLEQTSRWSKVCI